MKMTTRCSVEVCRRETLQLVHQLVDHREAVAYTEQSLGRSWPRLV
ncbi:MAG: hypothetical protein JWO04_5088 [Gammaproteobacteria bacterium]|nr:hypothetical protein [Gammaproteobacteria bacterium]